MKVRPSKWRLAIALVACAVAGISPIRNANATAIAFASNQLTGFQILTSVGSNVTVIGSPQRNTQNSATYGPNGQPATGVNTSDPQLFGNASDAAQATAGPVGAIFPGQNNFQRVTASTNPNMVGARADSQTSAGSGFDDGGVPFVRNVAEARMETGMGAASAGAGSNNANLSILYNFALAGSGTIGFQFTNLYEYYASTQGLGESAQATLRNIFTISDSTGQTIFTYSPDLINVNCASNGGVSDCGSGLIESEFSGTSQLLSAGNYTISLFTSADASVTSQQIAVPEPGTIAIFGLGLLSLAVVRARRK